MAVPLTTYQDIIDWALSQQRYEAANGQPAPLTHSERTALLELHRVVKPAPVVSEPEIGDTDWVSLLTRYRQANPPRSGISGSVVPFCEKAIEDPATRQPRWACFTSIDEHDEDFPLGAESGPAASFARKKDAKQFAARSAVEWLMERELMPSNRRDVTFPRQRLTPVVAPSPKRQKTGVASHPPEPAAASSLAASGAAPRPLPAPAQKTKIPSPPGSDEEASRLVSQLCGLLKITPPTYKIESEQVDFWSGYALFESAVQPAGLPHELGHVSNVYGGKRSAREAIAEKVYKELQKLQAEREATFREILAGHPATTD